MTRRRALAAGGAAVLTSTAGCSAVVDFVGEQVLEDVNVLNQLNREVGGSITVVGPSDETLLDATFTAPSTEADGESNVVAYADVWTEPGSYEVDVELADVELEGVSRASTEAPVDDTDADLLAVSVGSGDEDAPIAFRVGESFSELGEPTGSE